MRAFGINRAPHPPRFGHNELCKRDHPVAVGVRRLKHLQQLVLCFVHGLHQRRLVGFGRLNIRAGDARLGQESIKLGVNDRTALGGASAHQLRHFCAGNAAVAVEVALLEGLLDRVHLLRKQGLQRLVTPVFKYHVVGLVSLQARRVDELLAPVAHRRHERDRLRQQFRHVARNQGNGFHPKLLHVAHETQRMLHFIRPQRAAALAQNEWVGHVYQTHFFFEMEFHGKVRHVGDVRGNLDVSVVLHDAQHLGVGGVR
mmetsp:Transcript_37793/g.65304  ORF Transcript_37793/g.65304 Transcript_37793/m.65304 type:complete len:257 (+) Transcript_37793:115-885(+)